MADATAPDIAKKGYLKVRRKDEKKFKKRFAVLRQESATVDMYESDKKWKAGDKCKLSIPLKPCFSVSTKVEPKSRLAIGLMGATSFTLGVETEEELNDWLQKLRWVHQGGRNADSEQPRTQYERMWEVNISDRGLGSTKKLNGQYCVGLTTDGIQFINKENPKETYDVPFMTIRGCRHVECFFWMEVGRTSCFGAGEINMQLDERIYAQNMHEVIRTKFCNSRPLEPDGSASDPRPRVPSTAEASRPITVEGGRRNTISSNSQQSTSTTSLSTTPGRDRTWSVPSRPRTTSEGTMDRHYHTGQGHHGRPRAGVHSRASSTTAGSPPVLGSSFSPASVDSNSSYGTDDHGHPLHSENVIVEETGDYLPVDPGRGYALDVHDGGVASRKRSMPPLTLPIPASCDARQPAAQTGAYLPMTISPGGGVRQPAATDAGYLPMFYSPGSGDTPDGPITSPTPSQGVRGSHSRDSSLTEEGYMPMFRSTAELGSDDGSYVPMKPGTPFVTDDVSHSRSSSVTEPDGYVPMAPGQLSFAVDTGSPYMDIQPGKRASKISDEWNPLSLDSYAEVSPASSCSLPSGTPLSEAQLERTPLTVLTPPSEDASPARPGAAVAAAVAASAPATAAAAAAAGDRHNRADHESMRTRASSLGSRLSQVLMPRRRDRSESDSTSAERASTGQPEQAASLSSSLDSTVTSLKEVYRRRRKDSELREEAGSPATESKGSQDSLRHRPRSNSQSSQGSDKTHGGWRFLFAKRREKKLGSVPVDVPAGRGGSPALGRSSRSPAPAAAAGHDADHAYVDVNIGPGRTFATSSSSRRRRSKRREAPAAVVHYTDEDYLVMGPMHLDEDATSGGSAASSLKRRPGGRRQPPAEDSGYLAMEIPARMTSPLSSPQQGDYLNMDMGAPKRLTPMPASAAVSAVTVGSGATGTSDYLNMEIGGGGSLPTAVSPAPAAGVTCPTSDYLAMTPRAALGPPSPAAPSGAAGGGGDYLEMTLSGSPAPAPLSATCTVVQRSQSARTSAEREVERRPLSIATGSRRDPDTYCAVEMPTRPVSALLSVQTDGLERHSRRKSDTAPLDDRRRGSGAVKVQRKHSGGAAGAGAGLLRKLDAMNPRAMFRSLSQRGKKEAKRLSPGGAGGGGGVCGPDAAPVPTPTEQPPAWSGSSQSLSSSNSIQEEVDAESEMPPATALFRAAEPTEPRLGSASPCGSATSVTPRASLAGSQATTPRQTPAPTPSPAPSGGAPPPPPLTPLTTSSSLTNFGVASAAGPPPLRQRHESNPPPSSLQRVPRPQTGVGSQSLTTLPTEEQELVYASLDLADADAATCQPPAAAHRLTYAKIDFDKCETMKNNKN